MSSFYEICKIVGQENIEIDLLQYYDIFLESEDIKEKNIAIRNLPKILNLVSKEARQKYLQYFDAVSIFQTNAGDKVRSFNFISWKDKLDVLEGILCYYNLYENDIIYKSIIPQCITFCLDSVYKVRTVSCKVLGTLILYLYNENYKTKELFKILDCFALHKKFHQRINFIKICKILINNVNIYKEKIIELFFIIASYEKILNVKIALSKLLRKVLSNDKSPLYDDLSIHKLCQILLNKQKNRTIENIFKSLQIKETNEDIFNEYKNKYSEKEKIFKGNNKYFIEEFKIDYDEDNRPKNDNINEIIIHEEGDLNKKDNEIKNKEEQEQEHEFNNDQNFIKDNNKQNKIILNDNENDNSNINLNLNQTNNDNILKNINNNQEEEDKKED